jgi:asparagine N-glycosylation enzyme membrane subunit Stt3
MIEGKDILSFVVGLVLFILGVLPLLGKFGIGPEWFNVWTFLPIAIVFWVIALGALYLVINSVIEITNSASVGVLSIIIAFVCLVVGMLPIIHGFGLGPDFFALSFLGAVAEYLYNVIFIIEGVFLMIAMIAMEM